MSDGVRYARQPRGLQWSFLALKTFDFKTLFA